MIRDFMSWGSDKRMPGKTWKPISNELQAYIQTSRVVAFATKKVLI